MNCRRRLTMLAASLLTPLWATGQASEFVWRVSDISADIVRNDQVLGIGQYLRLRQSLQPRESGWTEMKIDLPENWQVLSAAAKGDAIEVVVANGTVFRLTKTNVGELTFRILDGSRRRTDDQLERIWRDVALLSTR
jgi:hypothetical protein